MSVLGRILFLSINDEVAQNVDTNVKVRLFLDGCIFYCQVKSIDDQELPNQPLEVIHNWSAKWNVEINFEDTACMTVSNKKMPLRFNYL